MSSAPSSFLLTQIIEAMLMGDTDSILCQSIFWRANNKQNECVQEEKHFEKLLVVNLGDFQCCCMLGLKKEILSVCFTIRKSCARYQKSGLYNNAEQWDRIWLVIALFYVPEGIFLKVKVGECLPAIWFQLRQGRHLGMLKFMINVRNLEMFFFLVSFMYFI